MLLLELTQLSTSVCFHTRNLTARKCPESNYAPGKRLPCSYVHLRSSTPGRPRGPPYITSYFSVFSVCRSLVFA